MENFKIEASAQRKDNAVVRLSLKIKAVDMYAASDVAKAKLAALGAEYFPVLKFGSSPRRIAADSVSARVARNAGPEEI